MSLTLDPRTTALVLIDVQNGILSMPLAPYDAAQIIRNTAGLGRHFNDLHATVVLVKVAFANNYADKPIQEVDAPMITPPGGLPAAWSEFARDIAELEADVVITKRQWGAFHGTELDLQLRRRGITTIVLGGIATNFGVEATAREAWQHNYAVIVAEDASTSVAPDMHRFSVEKILPRISRIRSTAEIIAALQPA
ncbi:MAG TPA: hydrolase [Stellaceae bacterium]|nr:hydrolase [Stellaceae bacterium]